MIDGRAIRVVFEEAYLKVWIQHIQVVFELAENTQFSERKVAKKWYA